MSLCRSDYVTIVKVRVTGGESGIRTTIISISVVLRPSLVTNIGITSLCPDWRVPRSVSRFPRRSAGPAGSTLGLWRSRPSWTGASRPTVRTTTTVPRASSARTGVVSEIQVCAVTTPAVLTGTSVRLDSVSQVTQYITKGRSHLSTYFNWTTIEIKGLKFHTYSRKGL